MRDADVRTVRSFNRLVTERVGALEDRYLATDRPLGEARLLWEIGRGRAEVRELRRRLALDSGYLSRLLQSLEAAGLVRVRRSGDDRRVRLVELTAGGRAERTLLDRRNERASSSLRRSSSVRSARPAAVSSTSRTRRSSPLGRTRTSPAASSACRRRLR